MRHIYSILLSVTMLLTACTEAVDNAVEVNKLPAIFPDYCGVAIPANIAPMNFNVTDNVDKVDVTVKGSKEGMIHHQGEIGRAHV